MGRKKKSQINVTDKTSVQPSKENSALGSTDTFINNLADIGSREESRLVDTPSLGFPSLGAIPEGELTGQPEPVKERKTRTKRQRKVELEECRLLLIPVFDLVSQIFESRGIQPLSAYERDRGVEAWHPILERYLPSMEAWAIWIPPAFWCTTVYMARRNSSVEKSSTNSENVLPLTPKAEPKKESVENASDSTIK